jgi:hypothetical protein
MERLKQGLAFPMFATAVWLLWVLGQQAGVGAMARVLMATGRRPEGRAMLEQVVATNPDHFAAQYYLGGALGVERDYDKAFWCFDAAVRAPNSVSALCLQCRRARAWPNDAAEAMQVSMRLGSAEAYRARAYAALGLQRVPLRRDALRYIRSVGLAGRRAETALVAAVACARSSQPAADPRSRARRRRHLVVDGVGRCTCRRTTAAQFLARGRAADRRLFTGRVGAGRPAARRTTAGSGRG